MRSDRTLTLPWKAMWIIVTFTTAVAPWLRDCPFSRNKSQKGLSTSAAATLFLVKTSWRSKQWFVCVVARSRLTFLSPTLATTVGHERRGRCCCWMSVRGLAYYFRCPLFGMLKRPQRMAHAPTPKWLHQASRRQLQPRRYGSVVPMNRGIGERCAACALLHVPRQQTLGVGWSVDLLRRRRPPLLQMHARVFVSARFHAAECSIFERNRRVLSVIFSHNYFRFFGRFEILSLLFTAWIQA